MINLKCFLFPGWEPRIRPASVHRSWMDSAAESFPYRCLPLGIANSHGWDILSPCSFTAEWNGGLTAEDVEIDVNGECRREDAPVALFGQGTFTIHIQGLFRTPVGWNLYVSGPPNDFKDGAVPLTGIIETDWSPYTFTMNWRLTRPHHRVRFDENEPIAHIFPIERKMIEQVAPEFVAIDSDAGLKAEFEQWSRSRNDFQEQVRLHPPERPADKWQKLYYRGLKPDGDCPASGHQSKLQVRSFAHAELTGSARQKMAAVPAQDGTQAAAVDIVLVADDASCRLAKYEWLLSTLDQQRRLSATATGIFRCHDLTQQEFLDEFYAPGRPAILAGEIEGWPATTRWTQDYIATALTGRVVEYQASRSSSDDFERDKDSFKKHAPFAQFLKEMDGNDAYITAYNSTTNQEALRPLRADMGVLSKFLTADPDAGMMWIGPGGTFTPLHHDLTNNLLVQVVVSKRVVLAPATALPNLYNDQHVFSRVSDVTDNRLDLDRLPSLNEVQFQEVTLCPGEVLFIPIGWWHQVRSLDFSVSVTYTNFLWRNDFHAFYPAA